MNAIHIPYSANKKNALIQLFVAICIVTLLFYIDEGYYNFNWTKQFGNWIIFFVYALFLFLGQVFTYHVLLRKYVSKDKNILASIIGAPLGFGLLLIIGICVKQLLMH
jgi:hypothetical protein